MKKLIIAIATATTVLIGANAFAHGGSHAPINEAQAMLVAADVVNQFVEHDPGLGFGKLKPSWKSVSKESRRIHAKKPDYYIVAITNRKEGKTLYVLMSRAGEAYDANFSGVFKGLK